MSGINPKSVGSFLLRVVEVYVPVLAFVTMFIAFNIQIFARYVLDYPLSWPWDLTVFGFLWTSLLGAIRPVRTHEHIQFSLVYTRRSELGKLVFRVVGELLLVVTFALAIYPSGDYIWFTRIMKSEVLRVPMVYVFAPFMFFIVLSTIYLVIDLVRDAMLLVRHIRNPKGGQP
jgi:TRAP-type C4-dicarboxylate transport system permease small subunit